MSATPEQRLQWRAELQGAEGVKAKMEALLNLQREGSSASEKTRFQAKLATQEIGMQNRAMSALTRSWQIAHPQLALLTRSFSAFAAIGRTVFNILQGINIMQIRQRQDTRDLADAQQKVNDSWAIYQKAVSQFGKDSPQALEALQEWNRNMGGLVDIQDRMEAGKWQDMATAISALMAAFVIPAAALSAINSLKALLAVSIPGGLTTVLGGLGTAVGAMAKAAPMAGPIITAILLLIERLQGGKPITLESIFGEGSFWAPFIKDAQGFIKFWEDLPKHIQIWTIRARRSIEKWWEDVVNVFTGGTKKALDSVNKWGADIIKYFQNLYKKIVGGSIWTDMLDAMVAQTREKLPQIADEFEALGTKVIGSIERIDAIARTRSLTGAERQELHGSQVSAHVLGGISGAGVNASRMSVYQMQANRALSGLTNLGGSQVAGVSLGQQATGLLFAKYEELLRTTGSPLHGKFNQQAGGLMGASNEDIMEFNRITQPLRDQFNQGSTINVYVQGSLLTKSQLVQEVSEAIAQGTQALIR